MNIVKKLKSLLGEAELYDSQGLLSDAMAKYHSALELIKNNDQLNTRQHIIDSILQKISELKSKINKIEKAPKTQELSSSIQDLIKKLFSYSADKDKDSAAFEGAITLAKFGQYKQALKEFNELIKNDRFRVVAAKNIIKCHVALASIDEAVNQYRQWLDSDIFTYDQLYKIRIFFEGILDKSAINKSLPQAKKPTDIKMPEIEEDETLDISSIAIILENGPRKGEVIELDVSFQSGNIISLIISDREKELIESLNVCEFDNIQFYSSIAMFSASGVISSISEIKTGHRKGNYNLDIKIKSA